MRGIGLVRAYKGRGVAPARFELCCVDVRMHDSNAISLAVNAGDVPQDAY